MEADQYLLMRNRIVIQPEAGLERAERVSREELSSYIRQRPNKRLFGIPFYLHIYNLSAPEKENWTKRIGEAPVIYDPIETGRSVTAMSIYMQGRGFFSSSVEAVTDTLDGRKIGVEYRVTPGVPSRLGTIAYDFEDTFVEPLVLADTAGTLIHSGEIFSSEKLQAERQRITASLKGEGYYNFSINNILYLVDTVSNPGAVNVKIRIRRRVAGYEGAASDEPILENNKVYRLRNIYIQPDYDPNRAAATTSAGQAPARGRGLDTLEYRGVNFIYSRELNVRPDVLMRAINIYPNDLYDADNVNRAYDNLMKLNYFRSASILFSELPDSLGAMITYIGAGSDSDASTQEGYLDCTIQCTPGTRQSYSIDLEGTSTSTYYGALFTLGYQNRNLLKGAESIDFSLTTGYEFMRVPGRKNSIELGGAVGISFPRFVAPMRIDRYNRFSNVRTRAELSVNYQNRPFYTRTLTSASWGYSWSNARFSSFSLRPIDISVVNVTRLDTTSTYYTNLRNPYLINSFDSQLIAGVSGSFLYNNQVQDVNANAFRLRINAETNGNLLNLLSPLVAQKFYNTGRKGYYYRFFGIRYAQYVRGDLDVSYKIATGLKTAIAARFYVGAGHAYGNSANTSIPFERQFYAGGPNSMRGWQVRTLGPGSTLAEEYRTASEAEAEVKKSGASAVTYPAQVGNFKLEGNLEFRFPIYKFLNGAVFGDLGNIWLIGREQADVDPESYFRFDRFYDQLALNTGIGARMDFGFFLFRIDWGLRLHDPNKPSGQKWIRNLTLRQSAFSFSVGYPF
jgi:outer membrane protein assembly factor BamA